MEKHAWIFVLFTILASIYFVLYFYFLNPAKHYKIIIKVSWYTILITALPFMIFSAFLGIFLIVFVACSSKYTYTAETTYYEWDIP